MASAGYPHPSYLTRQQISVPVSAGASGTSGYTSFLSDMRVRKGSVTVRIAGTSTGAGNQVSLLAIGTYVTGFNSGGGVGTALTTASGTGTLCTIVLGTNAIASVSTSTDMNTRIVAGCVLAALHGTDATNTADFKLEMYLDPDANWTGPNE